MSFDSTDLPDITGDDKKDTESVRKSILDLLDKINQTYTIAQAAKTSSSQTPTYIDDSRVTTGTANRNETVVALSVNQTAIVNWACLVTGGTGRVITFAVPTLPSTATYEVNLQVKQSTAGSNILDTTAANSVTLSSFGTVAAGSSFATASTPSGQTTVFFGFVKRIT